MRPWSACGASTELVLLPNTPCRKSTRFSRSGAGEASSSASHHWRTPSMAARVSCACRSTVASNSSSDTPSNRRAGLSQIPRAAAGRSGQGVPRAARRSTSRDSSPDNPSRVRSSAGVAAKARRRNRCRRSAAVRASPAACSCVRFMVPLHRARHPPAVRRAPRAEARPAGRAAGASAGRPRASTTGPGRSPPADRARDPLRAIPRGSRGRRSSRSAAVRSRP